LRYLQTYALSLHIVSEGARNAARGHAAAFE